MYYYIGDKIHSLKDINKAIFLSPEKEDFHFQKGDIYSEFGIYDSAVISYKKALSLDSLNSDTYLFLIDCYIHLDDYDNALKYLEKGSESVIYLKNNKITITPGLYPDLYIVANLFERGYNRDTTQYIALYGAGYSFFEREEIDSANYYLNKYLKKTPEDSVIAETYLMLGTINLEKDSIVKAKMYYDKAEKKGLKLPNEVKWLVGTDDKTDPVYFYNKGSDLFLEDEDSSIYYLKKYVDIVSRDSVLPHAYLMLGLNYLILGDTTTAKEYFQQVDESDKELMINLYDKYFKSDTLDFQNSN
jgi:tetratricopeptide (TPR) repeat protein